MKEITTYKSENGRVYKTREACERADIELQFKGILSKEAIKEMMAHLDMIREILKTEKEIIKYRDPFEGVKFNDYHLNKQVHRGVPA